MKKTIFAISLAFLLFSCDDKPVEKENPFVGTWESMPDGTPQYIFTADGKVEYREFDYKQTIKKYELWLNYFGTYTYEGKQAIIDWNYNTFLKPNTENFNIDNYRFKKTKSPIITDWILP